jgi:hypothetical protein
MDRVCIALVDATRARFFTFDRGINEDLGSEPLGEPSALIRHLGELDPRPPPLGKLDRHDVEFARMAMAAFRELIDEHGAQRAIVCANGPMLGKLRAAAPGILPDLLPIDALACDFSKLPSAEVRAKLAEQGLLPARAP